MAFPASLRFDERGIIEKKRGGLGGKMVEDTIFARLIYSTFFSFSGNGSHHFWLIFLLVESRLNIEGPSFQLLFFESSRGI